MAPISIFVIFARLLPLRAHFSTKFTKLSIVWQFSKIMSIFKKKSFSVMYHIGGIPGRRIFFFEKSFTPKVSQVAFLNIFSKFQKEVLENSEPQLTCYQGIKNLSRKYFQRPIYQIMLHVLIFRPLKNISGSNF